MKKELKRGKKITVGKLRTFLAGCRKDMPITFGAPRVNERPLVFGQLKIDKEKQILFLGLERRDEKSDQIPEWATRISVETLLAQIDAAPCDDDWKVELSGEIFRTDRIESVRQVLAFDIGQPKEKPPWKPANDDHVV